LHRVVAELFVKKEDELFKFIKAIDGNYLNCKADNLEWVFNEDLK
jgi:hypothetical protein